MEEVFWEVQTKFSFHVSRDNFWLEAQDEKRKTNYAEDAALYFKIKWVTGVEFSLVEVWETKNK